MRNGQKKELLFKLIEQSIYESKEQLKNREVFFSNKTHCSRITNEAVNLYNGFTSDPEEADTKLVGLLLRSSGKSNLCDGAFPMWRYWHIGSISATPI